jgi:glucose-6-phosphate-specific signal transduction histidine kinase
MSGYAHLVILTAVTSAVILLKAFVPTFQTFNGAFLLIPVLLIAWVSGWRLAVVAIAAVATVFFYRSSEPKAPTVKLLPPQASDRRERDVGVAL